MTRNGARLDFDARFQATVELIGRRWTACVIRAMTPGPARFSLLPSIPGISDRVLTERLRELERHGLVERIVASDRPISVTYQLTERSRSLLAILQAIDSWAQSDRVEVAL